MEGRAEATLDAAADAVADADWDASLEPSVVLRCSRLAPTSEAASEADSEPASSLFCGRGWKPGDSEGGVVTVAEETMSLGAK